jgi:hypothetical protein
MIQSTKTNWTPDVDYTESNQIQFAMQQMLMGLNTAMLAKVICVNSDSTLDVQPLTNYLDVDKSPITPNPIYNIPYGKLFGNGAGIITEYGDGDTVLILCCQRDITITKKTLAQSNPDSFRKFDANDAIVLLNLSNINPGVFISILKSGITIQAPNTPVNVTGKNVTITDTGATTIKSTLRLTLAGLSKPATSAVGIMLAGNVVSTSVFATP